MADNCNRQYRARAGKHGHGISSLISALLHSASRSVTRNLTRIAFYNSLYNPVSRNPLRHRKNTLLRPLYIFPLNSLNDILNHPIDSNLVITNIYANSSFFVISMTLIPRFFKRLSNPHVGMAICINFTNLDIAILGV